MTPSVTSNSLQTKNGAPVETSFKLPINRKGLEWQPVEPHLSVESDLIGATDETELLATLIVRRPVVLACVRLVWPCSVLNVFDTLNQRFTTCPVRIAELTLRDIFAAVSFSPLSDGSLKWVITSSYLISLVEYQWRMHCLPSYSPGRRSFHGSRRWVRLSLCTYECVRASGSYLKRKKLWLKKSKIFWLTLECSPMGRRLCYKPFQVQGRRTTLMKKEKGHIMIVPYYIMLVPWPTSHHLVVVVGPQVGLLAV